MSRIRTLLTDVRQPQFLILIAFVVLGVMYSYITPLFEVSDELWHYPMVKHLADGHGLPVQDPTDVQPWRQEGSQQPLYYALSAALTFWIDSDDLAELLWQNPHGDYGVPMADGNINLLIHRPGAESFPWSRTVLAVKLIRIFSVLMGAGTVYLTWRLARMIFPQQVRIAHVSASLVAFLPMFIFISASVNNDNLANLLSTASLFLIMKLVVKGVRGIGDSVLIGISLGLAALSKSSALGLIALYLMVLAFVSWRDVSHRSVGKSVGFYLKHIMVALAVTTAIAGWWYLRNLELYGDLLGWDVFVEIVGRRAQPATLRQLWGERWGFIMAFWGFFGGVNVPMPQWIYKTLNSIALLAFLFSLFSVYRLLKRLWFSKSTKRLERLARSEIGVQISALGIMVIWIAAVLVGLVRWSAITWASQGRLIFPAIASISIILAFGLNLLDGRRFGRVITSVIVILFFVLAAVAPFIWIKPAYTPLPPPTEQELSSIVHKTEANLNQTLELIGVGEIPDFVRPNDVLEVVTYWKVLRQPDRDWSIFVHLHDPVINAPVAQRDMYLGQGLVPATVLEAGQLVKNRFVLQVPETAYLPADLELRIGVYDLNNWERMTTPSGEDSVLVAPVTLAPSVSSEIPNPIHVNFGDKIALTGYSVKPRRCQPGDTVTLELHWQALAGITADYTVFAHIRDSDLASQKLYGQHDVTFSKPTSSWLAGDSAATVHHMIVADDAPPEVMSIEVGLYRRTESGGFERLQRVHTDGQITDDYMILTSIRVDH